MRSAPRGARIALGAALTAGALAGCGLAIGPAPSAVQLQVTRDFGTTVRHRSGALHAGAGETMLNLLASSLPVSTGSGGQVRSIDGLSGDQPAGAGGASGWSYYVNGVLVSKPPATRIVRAGDHVWWDLHDGAQTAGTQVVVGSFPEPFVNGVEGERLPVRVECVDAAGYACRTVTASLRDAGVPAAIAAVGSGGAPETLRVMVGPWDRIGGDLEAQSIARGPRASGVYARFSADGRALTLLDAEGRAVRTLQADAGLVAATRAPKEAPVWVVTGTDDAGVKLAAHAFDRAALQDHFALALSAGSAIPLPDAASAR